MTGVQTCALPIYRKTLQTGIPSVFAAGDGVTGPATIIEAIAQAKTASYSVSQFLAGLPLDPASKPFTSKKENFKKQTAGDYMNSFAGQSREEMPTLPPANRLNFDEVELGYAGEEVALNEAQRCLECGCVSFFDCDLQKYSTEYHADQQTFKGEFNEYKVDFRHPFIEIDNNKCILCARCVRICREVVGANALGLVNRGFKTYVSPSMGNSLQETKCESCGMCISTCPTGAITENVLFKPGPVKTASNESVCNYCSVGCSLEIHSKQRFVTGVSGKKGIVNADGNICRFPRFGYNVMNDLSRIKTPMVKKDGAFVEISFDEAFKLIHEKITEVQPDENAFFGGARLTNEELYLIHKLARAAVRTNNVGSFHYLGRGEGYRHNSDHNVPFSQITDASAVYLVGTELNMDHAVVGFMVSKTAFSRKIPVISVTTKAEDAMSHKVTTQLVVKSYYHFVKAVSHYILSKGLENRLFLRDRVEGFDGYKEMLLKEDYNSLVEKSGLSATEIEKFAEGYNNEINAVLIFSEKSVSGNTSKELFNLAKITGKLGKTANGLIALKEKNNSQGLFDMGVSPHAGIGGQKLDDVYYTDRLKDRWKIGELAPAEAECLNGSLWEGKFRNLFVFGEDPVGCAKHPDEISGVIGNASFVMVQDYFLTETARMADLIMPASFPAELGGTFTNAQKVIQEIGKSMDSPLKINALKQLCEILDLFNVHSVAAPSEIFMEFVTLLPPVRPEDGNHLLHPTKKDNDNGHFNFGTDILTKKFEDRMRELNLIN